jgi:putative transposase
MLLVYRYRIKSLVGLLNRQARACKFVWNFCNETQQHALKWNKRWPTGFDLESVRLAPARRGRKVSQTSE